MRKETKSIALACTLGAFVGAMVALKLAEYLSFGKYLWVVGALAGGLVAYIAYDFKAVIRGIAQAWRDVRGWRPHINWRRVRRFLVLPVHIFTAISGLCFWMVVPFWPLFWPDFVVMAKFTIGFPVFAGLWLAFTLSAILLAEPPRKVANFRKEWKDFARVTNIIMLPVSVTRVLVYVFWCIPSVVMLTARFVKRVFLYIHSHERVLCFVGAAIGAGIGYFVGSAIVGAIFGALFGVASYELLSVRVLKLVPRQHR